MSSENEGSENKQNVAETKKEKSRKRAYPAGDTETEKMLVYPLFFLLFAGSDVAHFRTLRQQDKQQTDS